MKNPAPQTVKTASVSSLQESVLVVQQATMEMIVSRNVMDVLVEHVIRIQVHVHTGVFLVSMVTGARECVPSVCMVDVIRHPENVLKVVILAFMDGDVTKFVLRVPLACVIRWLGPA